MKYNAKKRSLLLDNYKELYNAIIAMRDNLSNYMTDTEYEALTLLKDIVVDNYKNSKNWNETFKRGVNYESKNERL